jgi:hypothetical protein
LSKKVKGENIMLMKILRKVWDELSERRTAMKKIIVTVLLAGGLLLGLSAYSYASDWGTAGKVFAILEGVRVITGGHVRGARYEKYERVWVPDYVWRQQFIPRHTEFRPGYGKVVIHAHYERVRVQQGGHWEKRPVYGAAEHYSRR